MNVFGYYGLAHDPDHQARRLQELGVHKTSSDLHDLMGFISS
jgi:hypothetical protein